MNAETLRRDCPDRIVPVLYILFIHVRIAKIYNWKVFDHA